MEGVQKVCLHPKSYLLLYTLGEQKLLNLHHWLHSELHVSLGLIRPVCSTKYTSLSMYCLFLVFDFTMMCTFTALSRKSGVWAGSLRHPLHLIKSVESLGSGTCLDNHRWPFWKLLYVLTCAPCILIWLVPAVVGVGRKRQRFYPESSAAQQRGHQSYWAGLGNQVSLGLSCLLCLRVQWHQGLLCAGDYSVSFSQPMVTRHTDILTYWQAVCPVMLAGWWIMSVWLVVGIDRYQCWLCLNLSVWGRVRV